MEILKAIEERRAYRALSPEALPAGAAERIVQAGTLAPSCYNNQPWRIVTAAGSGLEALRPALSEGNAWALDAPMIIAMSVRASDDCRLDEGRDYALFDAGLCSMAMMLQATEEGLVAHPIAGYNPKKAKAALGIPKDHVLIALIIVGRKATDISDATLSSWQVTAEKSVRSRKPLTEVVSLESWNKDWN